jgi:HK97 family phage prohead protease
MPDLNSSDPVISRDEVSDGLAQGVDAVLDEAVDLLKGIDLTTLPPDIQQAIALLIAAEATADELLDALGLADPDELGEDGMDEATADGMRARLAELETVVRARVNGMDRTIEVFRQVEFESSPSLDGLTLEGYAAVFNEPTLIDSWEGTFREQMMPGAVDKTLAERMPVMMFDHGKHPLIGQMPIGTYQIARADDKGLYVKGRLSDNWLIEPVRDAIRDGAVKGMSVRMRVLQDKWTNGSDHIPNRSLTEIAIHEMGPVVFPAYIDTTVSVRSREVVTSLTDPQVKREIARLFAMGTDLSAARNIVEPGSYHSTRSRSQRKALLALLTERSG